MNRFIIRRILTAIPTLLFISFVISGILYLAPGDPTAGLPLSIPAEVREKIRVSLGLNDPFPVRYVKWLRQFFITEPLIALEHSTGIVIGDTENRVQIVSWTARGVPVMQLVAERMPQTLWVVGTAYLLSVLLAIPLGVVSAVKQNSLFDSLASIFSVVGYSLPTFFTGLLAILVFGIWLGWLPTIYDTTLKVTDWSSFVAQLRQMALPVLVLAFFQTAGLSRFTRSAMIDNLRQDYVRTARAKGLNEPTVVTSHVLRNSLIPVVTLIAIGIPSIFAGAIVTEQIFRVNGLGSLLILSIQSSDIPVVQTVTFIFAALVVIFSLVADIVYGFLDPRIKYD